MIRPYHFLAFNESSVTEKNWVYTNSKIYMTNLIIFSFYMKQLEFSWKTGFCPQTPDKKQRKQITLTE